MTITPFLLKCTALYLLLMNLTGFCLMGIDKQKAKKQKWRIPEKTLFLFPVLGGSLGATIGMFFFHHKTRHWYFRFGFPMILLIQIGIITYLLLSGLLIPSALN